MPRRRKRATVVLPRGVQTVISRGREYYYFQANRGTKLAGERVRLPNDPHAPEFWAAIRQAQGLPLIPSADTIVGLIDSYLASPAFGGVAPETRYQYRRSLELARKAWGALPTDGLRPVHVRALMDRLANTPSKANAFLGAMQALSKWARVRDLIEHSLTEGVERYARDGGHRPWSAEQIQCAHDHLTGMVRRGIMLMLYTGQRGSDVVRLGPTDVDEGGFSIRQHKTGRPVFCPIMPELAAEIETWNRRPGPYLLQASGKPYTRKLLWKHFDEARAKLPALADVTMHGLRATAVIRLRRAGLSAPQICDVIGMSPSMVERYCRFADRKESARAAIIALERARKERA